MLWAALILTVLAVVLVVIGLRITTGTGSADERAGGVVFIILAIMAGVGAVLSWVIAVTLAAFA